MTLCDEDSMGDLRPPINQTQDVSISVRHEVSAPLRTLSTDAHDPNVRCAACDRMGTVAVIRVDGEHAERTGQYCDDCWSAQRDDLSAMRVDFALSLYSWRQLEEELRILEVGFAQERQRRVIPAEEEIQLRDYYRALAQHILSHIERYPQSVPQIVTEFIDRHCDRQTKVS